MPDDEDDLPENSSTYAHPSGHSVDLLKVEDIEADREPLSGRPPKRDCPDDDDLPASARNREKRTQQALLKISDNSSRGNDDWFLKTIQNLPDKLAFALWMRRCGLTVIAGRLVPVMLMDQCLGACCLQWLSSLRYELGQSCKVLDC